jgi:hypothetical protein
VKRFFVLFLAAGCGSAPANPDGGSDEIPLVIDHQCPGGPACADQGDGKLYAAAAKRDVTPFVEPFVDVNNNAVHDPNEPFTDRNGNGRFDPVWLAGRNSGRQAFGVHDPTWVRCFVLRQNETTVAECAIDCVGYFQDELNQIRADLDPALGVDLVLTSATHDHQTQDTLGIWGPDDLTTGYDDAYMRRVRLAVVDAITESVHNLRPAKLAIGNILTRDADGDMSHYVGDSRDPYVIDDRLHLLQLDGEDGKPIVTVVNWAAHPDSLGSFGHYISSDWVHYMRTTVEAGTGSDVVYVNGPEGGQIGPGGVSPYNADGSVYPEARTYQFIEVWGDEIGRMALKAFDTRKQIADPKLAFRHTSFDVHVENTAYHLVARLHLMHKTFFGYDPARPTTAEEHNIPLTPTESTYLTLGPASIITCPGEMHPELFVGGYDGSHSGKHAILDTAQPNSPDLSKAPQPPYLIDLMDGDPENRMLFGLTGDMLGYIVARFNFVLDPDVPYVARAPGDHYEETNSIGPRAEPEIQGTMRQLVLSAKPKGL